MTGLADFFGWDALTAADNYMLNNGVQFALNIEPGAELCSRTVERYQALFQEDEAAQKTFFSVTAQLVELLDQDVSKQRLDSTHVCSHMATFGRIKLMAVTLKRALTQINRHERDLYESLPAELRLRYEPTQGQLFAGLKDEEARKRSRQQVAEDMFTVIVQFGDVPTINGRSSFKLLRKVFEQQVEVLEECLLVKKKTGGDVIQNPSDPDATYDGHKGAGYQIQLSETCSDENEVQLIVGAIPETAVAYDGDALAPMLEQLQEQGWLPEELLADTAYGSDANMQLADAMKVDLIAPTCGRAPQASADEMTLDDFAHHEETGAVEACPQSHEPLRVTREEVVSTNSELKNRLEMDRLPVRGKGAVFRVMMNKVTGWNILRASTTAKLTRGSQRR